MSFCNLPENLDTMEAGVRLQWPRGMVIRWTVTGLVPGWDEQSLVEIYKIGWQLAMSVCGVRGEYVSSARQANILMGSRRIDGPGRVLAEHQLPPRGTNERTQIKGWMDNSESKWVNAENPPARTMDLLRVFTHELGHGLGLGHAPQGSSNLMAPTVSHLRNFQPPWDIP